MGSLIRGCIGALVTLSLLAVSPLAQVRKVPPSSGGAVWGGITGTLSAQTDLQAALDAVTFDQDLNTTNAVEFASVTIPDVLEKSGNILTIGNRFIAGETRIHGEAVKLASLDEAASITLDSALANLTIATLEGFGIPINITPGADLNITASQIGGHVNFVFPFGSGDLNINGTPGVTNAAGCAAHTKGICTTGASPDDSPAALRREIAELRNLIASLLPARQRQ